MKKQKLLNRADNVNLYVEQLSPEQAATAMQAARMNAVELMDTADILFTLKRFPHSVAFSTLAIEEAGKVVILQSIFLGVGGQILSLWKSYRQHRAKTRTLNIGILGRVRAEYPEIPLDEAKEIAGRGPTPNEIETAKQRAIYSDCLETSGTFMCHLPKNVDWRQQAWERLCEARAIVLRLRDRTPEELSVWLKHAKEGRAVGKSLADILPDVHRELLDKGFVKEGWWDTLLKDIKTQTEGGEKGKDDKCKERG